MLSTLTFVHSGRAYKHAIDKFIAWYCSEPRLGFNRSVVLRYRSFLESLQLLAATINLQLCAIRLCSIIFNEVSHEDQLHRVCPSASYSTSVEHLEQKQKCARSSFMAGTIAPLRDSRQIDAPRSQLSRRY